MRNSDHDHYTHRATRSSCSRSKSSSNKRRHRYACMDVRAAYE
jgi:hypothetical protein